jgi:electron transfer flavoprotein alpha subunit
MESILLFAEHKDGLIPDAALMAAGLARELADKLRCELAAILLGPDTRPLVGLLGEHGVDRVLMCEDPALAGYAPEASVHVLASVISDRQPLAVLFAESLTGADLATRVSARLRLGFASRCTAVVRGAEGKCKATRLGYGDKLQTTSSNAQIMTLQQGIGEVKIVPRPTQMEEIKLSLPPDSVRLKYIKTVKADPRTIALSQAEFIVSGGNGVHDFGLLSDLADRLNAAVGGSRVVCDDGRLPRERQIGESGITVRPRCYVAFGISGASQHVRGMQESKVIIAVNTDRHAPLMKMANMAVVADAEAVMRAMLEHLNS